MSGYVQFRLRAGTKWYRAGRFGQPGGEDDFDQPNDGAEDLMNDAQSLANGGAEKEGWRLDLRRKKGGDSWPKEDTTGQMEFSKPWEVGDLEVRYEDVPGYKPDKEWR